VAPGSKGNGRSVVTEGPEEIASSLYAGGSTAPRNDGDEDP